ncbi:CopG family transcriptional regulator [Patescibacteria group bacterium]|nr:CopG family transcriptional regulator [Patescibacteria group bacterium]
MASKVIPVSLPPTLLDEIDQVAQQECRTRSGLIQEATRRYIANRKELDSLYRYGRAQAKKQGVKNEADIERLVAEYRSEK